MSGLAESVFWNALGTNSETWNEGSVGQIVKGLWVVPGNLEFYS